MTTQLWDKPWHAPFERAMAGLRSDLLIVSPFLQISVIANLLPTRRIRIRVLTRFSLEDFHAGVSDLNALEFLLSRGAEIKGIKHLHAKCYAFDREETFVTSANMTAAALHRNQEYGVISNSSEIVDAALDFFESLWSKAGPCLTTVQLKEWQNVVRQRTGRVPAGKRTKLLDHGVDMGLSPGDDVGLSSSDFKSAPQYFVKFFGEGDNRSSLTTSILDEIKSSGSHLACTYPTGRRPRQVKDGAVMFLARMVKGGDMRIYGRGISIAHRPGQDDATQEDISLREWKKRWSHYIRIRDVQFLTGTLQDGISLNELIKSHGFSSFASTARNHIKGNGNTDPWLAYRQQPSVALTPTAADWLNTHLEECFSRRGVLLSCDLNFV